jgi:hypothetical protein
MRLQQFNKCVNLFIKLRYVIGWTRSLYYYIIYISFPKKLRDF